MEDCLKLLLWSLLDDEDMAEVNFGMVFAIWILADFEAKSVWSSANSSNRELSKSWSNDKGEARRALRWLSVREVGKSLAKCSLLLSLMNANREEERDIDSTIALPKNFLMPSNKVESTGAKLVRLISVESASIIHPEKDWHAWRP